VPPFDDSARGLRRQFDARRALINLLHTRPGEKRESAFPTHSLVHGGKTPQYAFNRWKIGLPKGLQLKEVNFFCLCDEMRSEM